MRVSEEVAVLRCGADQIEVAAEDYTLAVNAAFIAQWRGSAILRQVRVTTGDLTVSGRRNQHGVEDRFRLVGNAVRQLGESVEVAGGGSLSIARAPVQIRLEDG